MKSRCERLCWRQKWSILEAIATRRRVFSAHYPKNEQYVAEEKAGLAAVNENMCCLAVI